MKPSLVLFFFLIIGFYACENEILKEDYVDLATSQAQTLKMSDEIIHQVNLFTNTILNSKNLNTDTVVELNVNSNEFTSTLRDSILYPRSKRHPNTIVLNFAGGYKISDYVLKGKLIVYLKDTLTLSGINKKIIYNEFYVDDTKFIGNKLITYKGSRSAINPANLDSVYYVVSSRDSVYNEKTQFVFNSYLIKDYIRLTNDTLKSVTKGYIGGIDGNNIKFTSAILATNPLVRYSTYPFNISGIIKITSESNVVSFDYGNGATDNKGSLIYSNGSTKTISLK